MKPVWILIMITLLLPPSAMGQKAVVSATKMNILYRGVDNILHIAVENQPCSKIVVKSSPDSIIRLDDCRYNFRIDSIGQKDALIQVGIQERDSVKWLGKYWFRIKSVPCPDPLLAGLESGFCNVSTLLSNPFITLLKTDSLYPGHHQFEIVSFSACVKSAKDSIIYDIKEIKGNRLPPELLSYFATAEPYEQLKIYDIRISMDGKPYPFYRNSMHPIFLVNDLETK